MKTKVILALTGIIGLSATLAGCGGQGSDSGLLKDYAVSDCGGFVSIRQGVLKDNSDYCAAERLSWSYNSGTKELTLVNTRVLLNCCGEHTVDAWHEDGRIVVQERDEPEAEDLRCGCMCVYDFRAVLSDVEREAISLTLEREVTDDPAATGTVFQGTIDLTQGDSGVVVVSDEDVDIWCRQDQ